MAAQTQITIRLPPDLLARLDRIVEGLSRPGVAASRADGARFVFTHGIDAAEQELGIKKSKKP